MRKLPVASTVFSLILAVLAVEAFGQSSNATVSGTVTDSTGAVLPGVSVTATNNGTGVVTSVLSNEAGVYNFASLLPGVYTVKAELPGFQTHTYTGVQLGNAAQVRFNFSLQVAGQTEAVEVTITADTLLATSSSSVGSVLPESKVRDLPLTSNNVLDLTQVMAGVYTTVSPVFGANETKFAGVSARDVNVQRDGISAKGPRWPTGLDAATEMNPDLIGEVKMILAPVDAEMGRGSGQVQIQTRSGTNQFHGAGVWSAKNSALDANVWENNRTINPFTGQSAVRPWRNFEQATAHVGGPIVRNKTHFFVLFDKKWAHTKTEVNPIVLTPCAQRGIFRYYDNWNNGNVLSATTATSTTPTIAVVDGAGNPKPPATNPNSTPHNGILRYASVFGPLLNTPTRPDCSDAVMQQGSPWDSYRTRYDPTGYVQNVLFKYMPGANSYDVGDGLNTAGSRWNRSLHGATNLFGIGQYPEFRQINAKIDHYFNTRHKISGTWSYESNYADGYTSLWPNTWIGQNWVKPQVLSVNFTSTLSSTVVNEVRFGMVRTGVNQIGPLHHEKNDELRKLLPKAGGVLWAPYLGAGTGDSAVNFQFSHIIGGTNFAPAITQRDQSPRKSYGDTISWTRGKHTFKTGAEYRITSSKSTWTGNAGTGGAFNNVDTVPGVHGGETQLSPVAGINSRNMAGLAGTATTGNQDRMENLLVLLSGSVGRVGQFRFINRPDQAQKEWNDPGKEPLKIRDIQQNEWAAFFKDDWKVTNRLTLNVGMRWDYYSPPWEKSGLTATLRGTGNALFGISGRSFGDWMQPGTRGESSELIFVGPNTPNPGLMVYPRDLNNFGPALGFALNLNDRTTIRGGYQIQYVGGDDLTTTEGIIGNPPGSIFFSSYVGDTNNPYLDLTSIKSETFPVKPPTLPVQQLLVTDRTQNITAYDANYINPYIQNLTLQVTRNLASNLVLDVRYIGTLTRKNLDTVNLNISNFPTNGMKEAFDAARSGGESTLLDRMFRGINIAGAGFGPVGTTVNGVPQTGAMHLRAAASRNLRNDLANGNYQALADSLYVLNYNTAFPGNQTLPFVPSEIQGAVLRYNGFAENFIRTNPQFNQANLRSNGAHSSYHSLQVQATVRPTHGLSLEGSYTWSKDLGVGTPVLPTERTGTFTFMDARNQSSDYTLLNTNRAHVFNSYGTFSLPMGPGKLVARNSSGWLARVIEDWQASWILNLSSGAPATLTAANMLYARGTPDQVRPFDFKKSSGVQWGAFPSESGQVYGSYFEPGAFKTVTDPQCAAAAANIRSLCTLQAVADAKTGQVVLQNPLPGTRGNVGLNTLEFAGTWRADMALAKSIRIREGLRATIRLDARNVFNHPTPGMYGVGFGQGPIVGGSNLNINSADPFGYIPTKGPSIPNSPDYQDSRQFELKMRLDF
ncbi:MAG TPA: TonB-dependent receptor [Terriglobia bacterium]|nr:TonB-dependent receptor [Terriglobia bacterium]